MLAVSICKTFVTASFNRDCLRKCNGYDNIHSHFSLMLHNFNMHCCKFDCLIIICVLVSFLAVIIIAIPWDIIMIQLLVCIVLQQQGNGESIYFRI